MAREKRFLQQQFHHQWLVEPKKRCYPLKQYVRAQMPIVLMKQKCHCSLPHLDTNHEYYEYVEISDLLQEMVENYLAY